MTASRLFALVLPAFVLLNVLPACDDIDDDDGSSYDLDDDSSDDRDDDAGGVCLNTCEFAFDDECDDGAAGSITSICEYGSDCGDCGPRDESDRSNEPLDDGDSTDAYACQYVAHSRTACPGSSDLFSENEVCSTIWASSYSQAQSECSEYTASDTDCYGSCCTRSYSTNVRVESGAC